MLLLRPNELVPTARIVDELWGEQPPATAVKTVQVFVSQLRKALGEGVLETQPGGYLLRVPPGTLDAQRFESLLDRGRRLLADGEPREAGELLREALALWRGPALADFQYEGFARNEIGRLDELRVVALEHRLEADLALGRHGEIVGELEALVRDQPLRERPRALLMLALYRSGRQADALAAYQEGRSLLVDELGLDPGQALQQLEKAILRQDPALELPAAAKPPPSPASAVSTAPPVVEAAEGRKTVTLVFCELAEAEDDDPESLRIRTSRAVDLSAPIVERHGGRLERRVGAGVTAVFGVPIVREDDALRAVRAAIDLREVIGLEARLAVETGEVVTDDRGEIAGRVVSAGARLLREAALGEIVLGEATYGAVAHAVEVTHGDPALIRLESLDPDAVAVPRRDDSQFVGRGAELERLRHLYGRVVAAEGARLVTIVGEPGIGKSRFAREAVAALEPAPTVLVGRCPPYGEGVTFWPLRELLRQAGSDVDLGGSSHEVFARVRTLLVELAAERPVAVLFDDVHWAEPTFLDLVEYLASRLGDARVMIVCLARPQLAEQRPGWLQPPAESISLEALSSVDSELLLESLGAPAAVRPRIAEAAEGNPLFAEQLAAIASEAGVEIAMPGSIRGVLHERLDRLDPDERAVLERASVAGRTFTLGAVIELSPAGEADRVHEHLLSLARKRFVRADSLGLDEGFRFQHALIRDAAYEGVPKATRADLHERTADRLRARGGDGALIGYHLEHAFLLRRDLGSADAGLGARASGLLRVAAQEAFARSDTPAAISLLERARVLVADDDPSVAPLLTELAYGRRKLGEFARAQEDLDEAIAAAVKLGDRLSELHAVIERELSRGWVEAGAAANESLRLAHEARTELEELGDELGLAWSWWLEANADLRVCRWRERAEALERALAHARRATPALDFVSTFSGLLAQSLLYGPTPATEAIARVEELLAEAADPAVRATLGASLAGLLAMQGETGDARRVYAEAAAAFDDLGLRLRRANHALIGAQIEMLAGEPDAAALELGRAREVLADLGARAVASTHAAVLADVLCTLGRLDEAEALAREAAGSAPEDDLGTQAVWRSALGRVLAHRDEPDEAGRLVDEALALTDGVEFPYVRVTALAAAAEVASSCGRSDDARVLLEEARLVASAKGNVAALHSLQFAGELQ